MESNFEEDTNLGIDSDFETPPKLLMRLVESQIAKRLLLIDDVEALIDEDIEIDDPALRELMEREEEV